MCKSGRNCSVKESCAQRDVCEGKSFAFKVLSGRTVRERCGLWKRCARVCVKEMCVEEVFVKGLCTEEMHVEELGVKERCMRVLCVCDLWPEGARQDH